MSTLHKTALEKVVNERMIDPAYAQALSAYLGNMKAGKYSPLLINAVVQKNWHHGSVNLYDAHAFMQIHGGLCDGTIASCAIPVGEVPGADRDVSGNNEKLSKLPAGFSARFDPDYGRGADSDGRIAWDFELGAHSTRILDGGEHENLKVWISPGKAPLEVGITEASRTLLHLGERGRVCRWPYGSKEMLLIFRIDRREVRIETIDRTPCDCNGAARGT